MRIKVITTGGTIDKIYFDQKSDYEVGEPQIGRILRDMQVAFDFEVVPLLRKDSLDLTDEDRELVRSTVMDSAERRILITHGTDTMTETAAALKGVEGKAIVFTGALNPARFIGSDAVFNIGVAVAAVQLLDSGVYIAMNGHVFPADRVRKNRELNRFEVTKS